MNIKTVAKMAIGVIGMWVAYVVSGKCGDYAKSAFDSRNDDNNDNDGEMVVIMNPEEETEETNED